MDNCFFHDNQKAKRQCASCKRMFCRNCDDLANNSGLCLACWKAKLKKDVKKLKADKSAKTMSSFYWGISAVLMAVVAFIFLMDVFSLAFLVGLLGSLVSICVFVYNLYMMIQFKKALELTEKDLLKINTEMQKILDETYKNNI